MCLINLELNKYICLTLSLTLSINFTKEESD